MSWFGSQKPSKASVDLGENRPSAAEDKMDVGSEVSWGEAMSPGFRQRQNTRRTWGSVDSAPVC